MIKKFESFSNIKIPNLLYHATYEVLLGKIKKEGLDTTLGEKAWEDSVPGYVYLATDDELAISFAENSEDVPEEWLEDIVVLVIDTSKLDKSNIFIDSNVLNNEGDTLEYRGVIPWSSMVSVTKNGHILYI